MRPGPALGVQVFDVCADVLEELVLAGELGVALEVVGDLGEVVAQAVEVYAFGDGRPPEVVVVLLLVPEVEPDLRPPRAAFREYPLHEF